MEITLTPIGNSQGIRIPKPILNQLGITSTLKLTDKNKVITLSPTKPRAHWPAAFTKHTLPESELTSFQTISTNFDDKEWQW